MTRIWIFSPFDTPIFNKNQNSHSKIRFWTFYQNWFFWPKNWHLSPVCEIKLSKIEEKPSNCCCFDHLTDLTGFPLLSLPLCQSFALNGAKLERKRCQQIQKIVVTRPFAAFAEQHSISLVAILTLHHRDQSRLLQFVPFFLSKRKIFKTNSKLILCGE